MMKKAVTNTHKIRGVVDGVEFELTEPWSVGKLKELQPPGTFVGRRSEMRLCRAAWGLNGKGTDLNDANASPMHFRLEGEPGVGKNAIAYELAIRLKRPLYVVQGHEDLTPEDLALALIPTNNKNSPFVLRAGPLASAIYTGGLVLFDEINRMPQRALAQLASVLDVRQAIFSAMANIWIEQDKKSSTAFRFCCAMNPNTPDAGDLPDYVDERTLPAIRVNFLTMPAILDVIRRAVDPPEPLLEAYKNWHQKDVSTRVGIHIVRLAHHLYQQQSNKDPAKAILEAAQTAGLDMRFR